MQEAFKTFLTEAVGRDRLERALDGLSGEASVSVRLNPFKPADGGEPFAGESAPVSWSSWGRLLSQRPVFTLDPLFHGGAYYVQDSSAMYVGEVLRSCLGSVERVPGRPLRVLDLCAAPGGKTTDAAASLRTVFGDDFLLVANEVMRNRAGILSDNVAVWGDPCVAVSSLDPSAFAKLPGFFDIIIADVPCSGEGMFRKDAEALEQWSEDNVALCAARQRRIVADVWPALRPGGIFIYSTCTFNRFENDDNAEWICSSLGASHISVPIAAEGLIATDYGCSLVPGFVPGEGQYCACMIKDDSSQVPGRGCSARQGMPSAVDKHTSELVSALFDVAVGLRLKGDLITAVPQSVNASVREFEAALPLLSAGCAVGRLKGRDFVPDADLALTISLRKDALVAVDADLNTALAFLHRDTVTFPDSPKGLIFVRYDGVGLGFVKNLGSRCNSLLPQSRRIRMDI